MSVLPEERPAETGTAQERITTIVRMLLGRYGLRQMDLAETLNINASTLTRTLQGSRSWKIIDLEKMASFFDVPVTVFFQDPDGLIARPATEAESAERRRLDTLAYTVSSPTGTHARPHGRRH